MPYKVDELQVVADALGFTLVDELASYQEKFNQFQSTPELQQVKFLMPLMQNLVNAAGQDRTELVGWAASGRFNGVTATVRPVHAGAGGMGSGAGHVETHIVAEFDPPLQLGLHITNESVISRLAQKVTGKLDIQTGRAALDRAIHVKAENETGARALLTDVRVQQILVDAFSQPQPWPTVSDKEVRIEHYGFETNLELLKNSLAVVTGIVAAMRDSADAGPVSRASVPDRV